MLRFSIRDLLWLTVVASVVICWYLDRCRIDQLFVRTQALEKQFSTVGADLTTANKRIAGLENRTQALNNEFRRTRR
jgi:hypothetical protein